jgi:haloacetate dehalogenase
MADEGFAGFDEVDLAADGTTVHGRVGGDGPPVLLLHGIPETHLMWHRVAPALAERFTVVATDLRGFGASGKPPSTPDHGPYAMREVANDQLQVMRDLGFDRFAVVGHDRGARCAYRLALDHPAAVSRLAVLDIVPTGDAFARADARFSRGFWVWSFLSAPEPVPERMILAAPDVLVDHMLDTWSDADADADADGDVFPPEIRAEYVERFRDPDTVHAICEEYRAAATIDVAHDRADQAAGRRIACPTLVLWSGTGAVGAWYDPLDIWRGWCAADLRGGPLPGGHFLPEEAPAEVTAELLDFLTERRGLGG